VVRPSLRRFARRQLARWRPLAAADLAETPAPTAPSSPSVDGPGDQPGTWPVGTPASYELADPELALLPPDLLHPDLRAALAGDPASILRPLGADLYGLPVLTEDACAALLAAIDDLEEAAARDRVRLRRPNSMNQSGAVAADLGLVAAAQRLVEDVVRPLAAAAFAEVGGASLDHQHAFVVEYGAGRDLDLDLHVDDAEVTLNLCLSDDFEGGALRFEGRRCRRHWQDYASREELIDVPQRPGLAVLHAGAHRHRALPTSTGRRTNLIVWCRSSDYRAVPEPGCPPWCGSH